MKYQHMTIPNPIPVQDIEKARDWRQCAWSMARDLKKTTDQVKRNPQFNNTAQLIVGDITTSITSRRVDAAVSFVDRIIEKYGFQSDAPKVVRNFYGLHWISMNTVSFNTFNMIEKRQHILCAAAIWILDKITMIEGWQERLFPILPKQASLLDSVGAPDLWDCCYERDLIRSVAYILMMRDSDVAPTETERDGTERYLTNSLNAANKQSKNVPSRNAYDALMALIPDVHIEAATASFETLFWKWNNRYFECLEMIAQSSVQYLLRLNKLTQEYNQALAQLRQAVKRLDNAVQQQRKQKKPVINPLLLNPTLSVDMGTTAQFHQLEQTVDSLAKHINQLADMLKQMESDYQRYQGDERKVILDSITYGWIPPETIKRTYNTDFSEKMTPLTIDNPYEICFALLWLIESGSDLPWLYGPCVGMMQEVADSLPWGIRRYDAMNDRAWLSDDNASVIEYVFIDHKGEKKTLPPVGMPNWYARRFVREGKTPDWYWRQIEHPDENPYTRNLSLAQLLYQYTGCIMPRDLHRYDVLGLSLAAYEFGDSDLSCLIHLFTALGYVRRQRRALNLDDDPIPDKEEEPTDQVPYEELCRRLQQAREENRRLRSALHDAERTTRDVKSELLIMRDTIQRENRELADLRDLIFNASEEEKEETPLVKSAFPYRVQHNTVVFGGHDSWHKAIREMLTGDIRFIAKDLVFDMNIIRNAEVIWIQPNALSHSQFYRIADAARQYHTPIRYFSWASAEKGAMQVIEADKSM